MSEEKIVTATFGPITADKIRWGNVLTSDKVRPAPVVEVVEVIVPFPGIHRPQVTHNSDGSVVVAKETLDHARVCAERLVSKLSELPVNEQAGDLLAMAYAILHYHTL